MLVRVAILLASLAWAGFVFTNTIGDPGRGERIAAAVLEDPEARAEVVAPIASTVMRTYALPPEQRPFVEAQVDRALTDPAGAQSFIAPFAGSWARLMGEDDPRPTEFDLSPLLAQFGPLAAAEGVVLPERLPVVGVPLPRTRLGWMDDVRAVIGAATLPLALTAAALFVIAAVIGDPARVLRRFGVWAIVAGLSWVALPPLIVWLARRGAPGADAVVAAALDEAVSGLLGAALVLVLLGVVALGASFAVGPAGATRPAPPPRRPAASRPRRVPVAGAPAAVRAQPSGVVAPRRRPSATTAEMPVVHRRVDTADRPAPRPDDDGDALWDYYSSQPR